MLWYALLCMLFLSVMLYTCIFVGADTIAALFNSEGNLLLQNIAAQGMRLYFIACPFAGINIILSLYFTAITQVRPAHLISMLRGFLLIIPLAFLLSRLFGLGGVWCAFPAAELPVAVLALILLVQNQKRLPNHYSGR